MKTLDFPRDVYERVICEHAVYILGNKELLTTRDLKMYEKVMKERLYHPKTPLAVSNEEVV